MEIMLADSHAHLLDERLRGRIDEIVGSFKKDGLDFVVEVGAGIEESFQALELAKQYEAIYCTLGVHPHYACEYTGNKYENWVRSVLPHNKVVAIGECGLDFHYMLSPQDSQIDVFERQIKLSHEVGLPLVVHSREAAKETLDILKKYKEILTKGILVHCYSYGVDELQAFSRELDCYFAFGGAITYKKTEMMVEALKACPRDRLMLETDCPYLAPCPVRGTVNEPKNVNIIAEFVAKTLETSVDEVARITLENTKRFYKIK
ncbi:MAG: TatD family hydrolase [Firmicutes bacterium]|nr:TatD family hydrolase [Bacillota bacterium]